MHLRQQASARQSITNDDLEALSFSPVRYTSARIQNAEVTMKHTKDSRIPSKTVCFEFKHLLDHMFDQ